MIRPKWAGLIAMAGISLLARNGEACSCLRPINDPKEAMRVAKLAVAARVVSIEQVQVPSTASSCEGGKCETEPIISPMARVRLKVIQEWKGSGEAEYSVLANYVSDDGTLIPQLNCANDLEAGEEYLVFASPNPEIGAPGGVDGLPQIDSCSPVGLLRQSGKAIKRLGKGVRHRNSGVLPNKALERTRRVGVPASRAVIRVSPRRSMPCCACLGGCGERRCSAAWRGPARGLGLRAERPSGEAQLSSSARGRRGHQPRPNPRLWPSGCAVVNPGPTCFGVARVVRPLAIGPMSVSTIP